MTERSTESVWREGTRTLEGDPAFGPVVREVGPVRLPVVADDRFAYLCRTIVYQQLAGRAAATIHGRLVDALDGEVTPRRLLRASGDALQEAGVSRSKGRALGDLAEKVASGALDLEGLDGLDDEQVVDRLTSVWGIGPWTARMFLLFQLRRSDVWPVGDLGVRRGWARIHGLEEPPAADELEPRGAPYRPWRSAVAWYCWRAVEVLPGPT